MAKFLGRHLIAELYDCDEEILNNVTEIEYQMTKAAIECGATIVTSTFHRFFTSWSERCNNNFGIPSSYSYLA